MITTPLSRPLLSTATNSQYPDNFGRFGRYGGKYVPETLMPALSELEAAYAQYKDEPDFLNELHQLLKDYVGRPSPL